MAQARVRILQVIPDLGGGGAERMVLNLSSGLDRSRYEVMVVSLYGPQSTAVERELRDQGIPIAYVHKSEGLDPRMVWRLRDVMRRFRPDVIHTHRYALQYALPASLSVRGTRVVHTVHNLAPLELPWAGQMLHRVALRCGTIFVAIGGVVAESFRRHYGRPPGAVIGNGIPVSAYGTPSLGRLEWRARENLRPDDFVFACAARLQRQKNIPLLVRAVLALRGSAHKSPKVLIAGDGPLRVELERMVTDCNLASQVRFLGARRDVPALLAAADAFVLSSEWEGNPLAVMEAMAAGLPVIATRVGGLPEIVEHGVSGILVDTPDAGALGRAMSEIIGDPDRRHGMAVAARIRARQEFDVAVMARRYADLYENVRSPESQP